MTFHRIARRGFAGLLLAAVSVSSAVAAQQTAAVGSPRVPPIAQSLRTTIEVCCPPIANQSFNPYFVIHQLPGKNITQTYGLTFAPTAALDAQMKAYAPFAGLFAPAGWIANSVLLSAEMKELTIAPTQTPNSSNFAGTTVFQGDLRGWWAIPGSGIWNGPTGQNWEYQLQDGKAVSPNHMQPNKWYMIKLHLRLASKVKPDDNSWRVDDINCMTKYVAVMVRSVALRTTAGAAPSAAAMQIVEVK